MLLLPRILKSCKLSMEKHEISGTSNLFVEPVNELLCFALLNPLWNFKPNGEWKVLHFLSYFSAAKVLSSCQWSDCSLLWIPRTPSFALGADMMMNWIQYVTHQRSEMFQFQNNKRTKVNTLYFLKCYVDQSEAIPKQQVLKFRSCVMEIQKVFKQRKVIGKKNFERSCHKSFDMF